jgi:hypothetical protein
MSKNIFLIGGWVGSNSYCYNLIRKLIEFGYDGVYIQPDTYNNGKLGKKINFQDVPFPDGTYGEYEHKNHDINVSFEKILQNLYTTYKAYQLLYPDPIIIGHSFGGLLAILLKERILSYNTDIHHKCKTIAICPLLQSYIPSISGKILGLFGKYIFPYIPKLPFPNMHQIINLRQFSSVNPNKFISLGPYTSFLSLTLLNEIYNGQNILDFISRYTDTTSIILAEFDILINTNYEAFNKEKIDYTIIKNSRHEIFNENLIVQNNFYDVLKGYLDK